MATTPTGGGQSGPRLISGDAVAALIMLEDGRYLLQHRDDDPRIWFPGYWGCFGGAVDDGEEPLQTLRRELWEELELEPREPRYFTRFDFDFGELGMARHSRSYYVVELTAAEACRLVLHEGQAMAAFSGEAVFSDLRVTPYDVFALFVHHARHRIGRGWLREAAP